MIEVAIYGCWGSGTSLIANILMKLGYNPGKKLLGEVDARNPETSGENLELRAILIEHIPQKTLELKNGLELQEKLKVWAQENPNINLVKHPLITLIPDITKKAWPGHKRIIAWRSERDIYATMERRGWEYWKSHHLSKMNFEIVKDIKADDFIFDYDKAREDREDVIASLSAWLGKDFDPIQIRNAISTIRPKVKTANSKIFIACPSLSDPLLLPTIKDCFENALDPQNITFSIYDQRDESIDEEIEKLKSYGWNIEYRRVPVREAKGVGKARLRALGPIKDESWYLQIDSHMKFARHWDAICFDQWYLCKDERAVLSTALPGCNTNYRQKNNLRQAYALRYKGFNPFGVPVVDVDIKDCANSLSPVLHQLMVAHFMFCPSSVIATVPPDPRIYFMGEEMLYALRLFTNGYNIYAPFKTSMLHYYAPTKARPRQWTIDPNWEKLSRESARIIQTAFNCLLSGEEPADLGYYGLGSARSLADFEQFLGVNFYVSAQEASSSKS